ncbi:ABC transporter substrate binding protein [Agarivorans sp. DSG3-1]|uniref:ABC transporter substrate binding protein n=1 Tax=Agarivorans sp. DSG3-1 TaxID=3342249 RepID=UPI00398EFF05
MLNSYQAGMQWDASFDLGLRQQVGDRSVWMFNHRIEPSPNQDPSYRLAQFDLLNEIILYYQFDLVVSVGEQALNIALALQDEGILQAPIVAAGADLSAYMGPRERRITGIHEQLAIRENLLLIRQLIPDLEAVHLLIDDQPGSEHIRKEFIQLADQLAIPYTLWQEQDYEEVKAKTSLLSANEAILLGVLQQAPTGKTQLTEQRVQSLSMVSRAPMYSLWEYAVGNGAVGGFVTQPKPLGEAIGNMVLKVLLGTDVRDVAINTRGPQTYLFDSTQLNRWKVSRANLATGSEYLNQQAYQSWSQRYQTSLMMTGLSLFAGLLLFALWRAYGRARAHLVQQKKQLSSVFSKTEQACALLDENGHVLLINQALMDLLGDRAGFIIGNSLLDSHIWEHQSALKQQLREGIAKSLSGDAVHFQAEFDQGKHSILYDFAMSPQLDQSNRVEQVVLEMRNLALIQQQHRQLKQSETHYRLLFEQSPALLMLVNRLGVIVCCNKVAAKHLGYPRKQLELSQLRSLYGEAEQQTTLLEYLDTVGKHKVTRQIAYRNSKNQQLWFKESFVRMAEEDVFMLVCEDVTATRSLAEELDFHANFDLLTGIYNRGFFERRLELLLGSSQDNQLHALLFIDLAQFKVINDTFGHGSGDQALKQVAGVLEQLLPRSAIVARLGSDEFAILLEACSQQDSLDFANRVIDRLNDSHYVRDERMFSFGCSIGLTLFQQQQGSAQELIAQADNACFTAKSLGRNRVYLYQMDDQMLLERQGQMEWVTRIQQALREERFLLYAQAIVPVTAIDDDYLHYEVLLRMIDEAGRIVPPGAFLPAAENYNLADQIDKVVIAKSLQWLAENPGHLTRLNMCSMNLSGQSLGSAEFVEWLLNTLENSALPMNKLCFETTETVAIANLDIATEFFNKVRQLGCKIALDDFGSGLSSFGYLKNLPIDYLKIDGIFIRDLENDHMDAAIVKSINQMAHVMGKKTIAEFVENDGINQILSEIGVDYAQGYHFGKPVPIEMLVLN